MSSGPRCACNDDRRETERAQYVRYNLPLCQDRGVIIEVNPRRLNNEKSLRTALTKGGQRSAILLYRYGVTMFLAI
jgi:hypothetical protein